MFGTSDLHERLNWSTNVTGMKSSIIVDGRVSGDRQCADNDDGTARVKGGEC